MKLEVSEYGAIGLSFIFASFFVMSVYIWKPVTKPPLEML